MSSGSSVSSSQSSSLSNSANSVSSVSASSVSSQSLDQCADGIRRIELVPLFQKNFTIAANVGFRLRVTAQNPCFMDAEIFRYYRYASPQGGQDIDEFSGVCSWPDLEELPADEPLADACPKAFRQNFFDIVVDTESLAHETWELVKQEVATLVDTINDGELLEAQTPYWAGGAPS